MLLEQVIVQAIQGLKGRIEDEIVSGGYAPSYVDWLKKQVPEADEWTVSRDYDELQRAFSKRGIKFTVDDSKKVKLVRVILCLICRLTWWLMPYWKNFHMKSTKNLRGY